MSVSIVWLWYFPLIWFGRNQTLNHLIKGFFSVYFNAIGNAIRSAPLQSYHVLQFPHRIFQTIKNVVIVCLPFFRCAHSSFHFDFICLISVILPNYPFLFTFRFLFLSQFDLWIRFFSFVNCSLSHALYGKEKLIWHIEMVTPFTQKLFRLFRAYLLCFERKLFRDSISWSHKIHIKSMQRRYFRTIFDCALISFWMKKHCNSIKV